MSARVGYNNLATLASSVSASSEDSAYPAANLKDWAPQRFFKPTGSGTVTVAFTLPGSMSANYFAFYNQNLASVSGTIKLQYYNGSIWVDASATVTPTDNKPVMIFFTPTSATQWRISVSCSGVFYLGVIAFGTYLGLQNGMYKDWTPPVLADNDDIIDSESDGGFLGRSVRVLAMGTDLQINGATDAWMRSDGRAFLDHAKAKPFFFLHNFTSYPSECAFCWTDGRIPKPSHSSFGYMTQSIPIKGRVK